MTDQPLPPPPTDPTPPPSEPPVLKVKSSSRGVLYGVLACVAIFVIFVVVVAAASSGSKSPGVTFASSTEAAAPTTTATTLPTTTAPPPHTPTPEDFQLEVIETSRSCFGSAGCNIKYKINPTYTGPTIDSSKSYTIIYEVTGAEDLKTDNFTMRGDKWSGSSEDFVSAPTGAVLAAKVTRVV